MTSIKKNIPLIDQHDKNGLWEKVWRKLHSRNFEKT